MTVLGVIFYLAWNFNPTRTQEYLWLSSKPNLMELAHSVAIYKKPVKEKKSTTTSAGIVLHSRLGMYTESPCFPEIGCSAEDSDEVSLLNETCDNKLSPQYISLPCKSISPLTVMSNETRCQNISRNATGGPVSST